MKIETLKKDLATVENLVVSLTSDKVTNQPNFLELVFTLRKYQTDRRPNVENDLILVVCNLLNAMSRTVNYTINGFFTPTQAKEILNNYLKSAKIVLDKCNENKR